MPEEIRIWGVGTDESLTEYKRTALDLESRLEEWIERDISILDPNLLVIGKQVETEFGGFIDLLCIDSAGDLVVLELKRNKTPREVTAQALDYGSWVKDLSSQQVLSLAKDYLGKARELETVFQEQFGEPLPDSINDNHRMLVVASRIDPHSERIIKYLSAEYGVDINAATFNYFRTPDGGGLLARVFLIEPSEAESQVRKRGHTKRRSDLTFEELEQQAATSGVLHLYEPLVEALEQRFRKTTTRSSVRFQGRLGKKRRALFSLLPCESDSGSGLKFQVYGQRMAQAFGVAEEEIESIIPKTRAPWSYPGTSSTDPEWTGFEGRFTSVQEVNRFLEGLQRLGG